MDRQSLLRANAMKNPYGREYHDASAVLEYDVERLAEARTAGRSSVFNDCTFSPLRTVNVDDYVTNFKSLRMPSGRHANCPACDGFTY